MKKSPGHTQKGVMSWKIVRRTRTGSGVPVKWALRLLERQDGDMEEEEEEEEGMGGRKGGEGRTDLGNKRTCLVRFY